MAQGKSAYLLRFATSLCILGAGFTAAAPAWAGFEWTPSPGSPSKRTVITEGAEQAKPSVAVAPVAPVVQMPLPSAAATVPPSAGADDIMIPLPGSSGPAPVIQRAVPYEPYPSAVNELPAPGLKFPAAKTLISGGSTPSGLIVPQGNILKSLPAPTMPGVMPVVTPAASVSPPPRVASPVMANAPGFPLPGGMAQGSYMGAPPVMSAAPQYPVAAPDGQAFEEVAGFGKDVPLALALRQIVPPEYAFSFAGGVNAGQRVSWNGGKSWPQVIFEMLDPLGMGMHINASVLYIHPKKPPPPPQMPPLPSYQATPAVAVMPSPPPVAATSAPQPLAQAAIAAQPLPPSLMIPPSPVPAAAPVVPPVSGQKIFWEAKAGSSLKQVLTEWCAKENAELVWKAPGDFTIPADMMVSDTFKNALKRLFSGGMREGGTPGLAFTDADGPAGKKTVVIGE